MSKVVDLIPQGVNASNQCSELNITNFANFVHLLFVPFKPFGRTLQFCLQHGIICSKRLIGVLGDAIGGFGDRIEGP